MTSYIAAQLRGTEMSVSDGDLEPRRGSQGRLGGKKDNCMESSSLQKKNTLSSSVNASSQNTSEKL